MNLVVINAENLVILQRNYFRYFRTNKSEQLIRWLIERCACLQKFIWSAYGPFAATVVLIRNNER